MSLSQAGASTQPIYAQTLTYNAASQVATVIQNDINYVWKGRPRPIALAYDGLNRDSTITALSGGYDADGDLANDGQRTFVYDAENRLVNLSATPGATWPALTLSYDPLGRLSKTTTGAGVVTNFLYDGDRLIGEYDASSNPLRHYVHGPGVDEPLVWYEGASKRWLHADRQGSIIATSDASGLVTPYTYGAYGEPSDWGALRFRYTGQIALQEAQIYHYKARVYDPVMGHFLQTDPVGYKDDLNLYAYVGNDPTNKADPTGLTCTGSGDEFDCKMDDPGKLSKSDVRSFNKAYTSVVKSLQSHPSRQVTVSVDGKSFKVTAGEVASQLAKATVIGTNKTSKTTDMETVGGAATGRLPGGAKQVTVYANAFHDGTNLRSGITHEGLHMVPQERNVVGYGGAAGNFQEDHQTPYNNKADELLRDDPR